MTVQLEEPRVGEAGQPAKRANRRGSETRQRTEQLKLRLLPVEREALEQAAHRAGFNGTLQQFILHKLVGELDAGLATA